MCTFRATCYSTCLSWAPRQKKLGLDWGKNRLSRYICAEGALPASITVIARLNHFGLLDVSLKRINSKI